MCCIKVLTSEGAHNIHVPCLPTTVPYLPCLRRHGTKKEVHKNEKCIFLFLKTGLKYDRLMHSKIVDLLYFIRFKKYQ